MNLTIQIPAHDVIPYPGSIDAAYVRPISDHLVASLRSAEQRAHRPTSTTGIDWLSFAANLDRLVSANPQLQAALTEKAVDAIRVALVASGEAVPSRTDVQSFLRGAGTTARDGTAVQAFWWGFHVQLSHEDLASFVSGAQGVNTIVGTIGGSIPSPAAPWIRLAAEFIAGALGLLSSLDRGAGVFISMSWFAPGIFVPTSV